MRVRLQRAFHARCKILFFSEPVRQGYESSSPRPSNLGATSKQRQNRKSRAKKSALHKDPHLRSSPILGEGNPRSGMNCSACLLRVLHATSSSKVNSQLTPRSLDASGNISFENIEFDGTKLPMVVFTSLNQLQVVQIATFPRID